MSRLKTKSNPKAAKTTTPRSDDRLDFRLGIEHKKLIERAAAARGQKVSEFGIAAMVGAARQAIEEELAVTLSNRDRDRFIELLDAAAAPNAALRAAAKRYKTARGSQAAALA